MKSSIVFLFFFLLSSIQVVFVTCAQFQVGESQGWEVPSVDHDMYNEWASTKRFKVDDTLSFSYKKSTDSVLEVTEAEYKKCHSEKPIHSSSNGESTFKLDRSGSFYFISGNQSHCLKGQKLIVKVLGSSAPGTESPAPAQSAPPTQSMNQTESPAPTQTEHQAAQAPAHPDHTNNAVAMPAALAITFKAVVISFLGVFFC